MKVIVTGAVGFIGTNLVKRLLRDNHQVISLDNYSTGFKENEQNGCEYIDVDISDKSKLYHELSKFDKPDLVFHLAALARIKPSFDNPTETFNVNVNGTINILDWAKSNGNIPVVYAGSSSSHGDLYSNPYTFTKWQGELLCEMYNKIYRLPNVITRFYNVYGPHQILDGAYAAVIGVFEKQYRDGQKLTITGNGEQRRDFTHVDDIVDGLVRSGLNIEKVDGKILELGRGVNFSINEIASFYDRPTKYIEKRPGEMWTTLCESIEARELLNWNPTIGINDYIVNWVKNENK